MRYPTKWYLLRYLTCITAFFDGLIGIITFGVYCPYWCLWANCKFMDYNDEMVINYPEKYTSKDSYQQFKK